MVATTTVPLPSARTRHCAELLSAECTVVTCDNTTWVAPSRPSLRQPRASTRAVRLSSQIAMPPPASSATMRIASGNVPDLVGRSNR